MRKITPITLMLLGLISAAILLAISARPVNAPMPPTGTPPDAANQPTSTSRPITAKTAAVSSFECGFHPITAQIVEQIQPEPWMTWIRQLSGAEPVTIGGQETTIRTRWTPVMFGEDGQDGQTNARAFEYVLETVSGWYDKTQIEVQEFPVEWQGEEHIGKNLILTLPGVSMPDEVVILSAHLDSISYEDPASDAPGAEDNGTGSAALLEAARLFRDVRFERTLRIIWFTGEEQGLVGSRAYVSSLSDPHNITGVVNLDMFGYDSDGDRCFELHAGRLPASNEIGQCFLQSAEAYQQELHSYDYLTDGAIAASDHGVFWDAGIGAIEILENLFDNQLPEGCSNADKNEGYHSAADTVEKINPDTGIRIVRAALATAAAMAGVVE